MGAQLSSQPLGRPIDIYATESVYMIGAPPLQPLTPTFALTCLAPFIGISGLLSAVVVALVVTRRPRAFLGLALSSLVFAALPATMAAFISAGLYSGQSVQPVTDSLLLQICLPVVPAAGIGALLGAWVFLSARWFSRSARGSLAAIAAANSAAIAALGYSIELAAIVSLYLLWITG
jgi:hypothetical protein